MKRAFASAGIIRPGGRGAGLAAEERMQTLLAAAALCVMAVLAALWFCRDLCWFRAVGATDIMQAVAGHLEAFAVKGLCFVPFYDYSPLVFFIVALFLKIFFGSMSAVGIIVFNGLAVFLSGLALARLVGRRSFGLALLFYFSLIVHYPMMSGLVMEVVFPLLLFLLLGRVLRMREEFSFGAAAAAAALLAFAMLVKATFVFYCTGPFLYLLLTCGRRFRKGLLLFAGLGAALFFAVPWLVGMPSLASRLSQSHYFSEILNEAAISSYWQVVYVPRDNLRQLFFSFICFSPASVVVHVLFFAGLLRPKTRAAALVYAAYLGFVAVFAFYPSGRDKINYYYPMYGLVCAGAAQWLAPILRKSLALRLCSAAAPVLSLCLLVLFPAPLPAMRPNTFEGVNVSKIKRVLLENASGRIDVYLFDFVDVMQPMLLFEMFDRRALAGRYRFMSDWPDENLSPAQSRSRFREFWENRTPAGADSVFAVMSFIPRELEPHLLGVLPVLGEDIVLYVFRCPDP